MWLHDITGQVTSVEDSSEIDPVLDFFECLVSLPSADYGHGPRLSMIGVSSTPAVSSAVRRP